MRVAESEAERMGTGTTFDGVKKFWKDIQTTIVLVVSNIHFSRNQRKERFPDDAVMELDVINSYRMTHESAQGRPLGDLDARVVLVMLENFKKTESELKTPLDQWLYAFKDEALSSGDLRIPLYKRVDDIHHVGIDNNPGISSFYNILNKESVRAAGDLDAFAMEMLKGKKARQKVF